MTLPKVRAPRQRTGLNTIFAPLIKVFGDQRPKGLSADADIRIKDPDERRVAEPFQAGKFVDFGIGGRQVSGCDDKGTDVRKTGADAFSHFHAGII